MTYGIAGFLAQAERQAHAHPAFPKALLLTTAELQDSPAQAAEPSPSSATARTGSVPRGLESGGLRSAMVSSAHSFSLISTAPPPRQLVIRSDPALVTCFDPADKELYDLWAPKR